MNRSKLLFLFEIFDVGVCRERDVHGWVALRNAHSGMGSRWMYVAAEVL